MAAKDTITKVFMRDKAIFADVFNFLIYGGKQTIKPESLRELDSAVAVAPHDKDGRPLPEQKARDILKLMTVMEDDEAVYVALGIENQSQIHYAMPVRIMRYDSDYYSSQVEETAARHKANNDRAETDGEFLSGFYRDDKLIPVITVVFYFGTDKWTGARSLYEMFPPINEALRRLVPDYPINLIAPFELSDEEIERFVTDIKLVIQCLKYANDRKRFKEIVSDNPAFEHISRPAADVINVMTKANLTFPENEEEVNMCLAIEGIREEGRAEGREEGRIEGRAEGREEGRAEGREEGREEGETKGILKILHTLVEKGLLAVEDAAENAGLSVEEFMRSKP